MKNTARIWITVLLIALGSIMSSQTWVIVHSKLSTSISYSAFDTDGTLASLCLATALILLVSLYTKTHLRKVLLLLGLIGLIALCYATVKIALGDFAGLAPLIEKATGISGWQAQNEAFISSIELQMPAIATGAVFAIGTGFAAFALSGELQSRGLGKLEKAAKVSNSATNPDVKPVNDDIQATPGSLWSETSS